jgi:hypothetical protein
LSPTPEWCAREKPTTFEKQKPYTSQQQKRKGKEKKSLQQSTIQVRRAPNDRTRDTNRERRRAKTERSSARRETDDARSKLAWLARSTLSHYTEPEEGRSFSFTSSTFPFFFLFLSFFLSFFVPFSHFVSLFIILFKFLSF